MSDDQNYQRSISVDRWFTPPAVIGDDQQATEALRRYPGTGTNDGEPCICTRECPAVCDGRCGCEACLYAWLDFEDVAI